MARQDEFSPANDMGRRVSDQESARAQAGELKEEAIQRGKQKAESGKERAADQAENVAAAAERISQDLRREFPRVADYTNEIADSIRDFANGLRNRSIDDLLRDTQELARRNPTLFFLGSAAVGVALARFFKASAESEHGSSFAHQTTGWDPGRREPEHRPEDPTRPIGGTD